MLHQRPRFHLRTMLALVAACAVVFGLARIRYSHLVAAGCPLVLGGSFCGLAFAAGRATRRTGKGLVLIPIVAIALAGAAYAGWARYRTSETFLAYDLHGPQGWPYPDTAIWALNDWYDVRYPAPPRYVKIHGELPRVRLTLDALIAALTAVAGFGLGLLRWRRNEPTSLLERKN